MEINPRQSHGIYLAGNESPRCFQEWRCNSTGLREITAQPPQKHLQLQQICWNWFPIAPPPKGSSHCLGVGFLFFFFFFPRKNSPLIIFNVKNISPLFSSWLSPSSSSAPHPPLCHGCHISITSPFNPGLDSHHPMDFCHPPTIPLCVSTFEAEGRISVKSNPVFAFPKTCAHSR